MNIQKYIAITLVGILLVFATFFLSWVQTELGSLFNDFSFFLSDGGTYLIEFVFVIPLFIVFLTSEKAPTILKWLVVFFSVRFVLALITYFLSASITGSIVYTVLVNFYGVVLDIALLVVVLILFNRQTEPFVSRALLVLWAMLSLGAFAPPPGWEQVLEISVHTSFVIGMIILLEYLVQPQQASK